MSTEMTKEELNDSLRGMRYASGVFYSLSVQCNNHAFIEFTGLMNEYIKVCAEAAEAGRDFTQASVHTGNRLEMRDFQKAYIREKLDCIFGEDLLREMFAK